MKLVAANGEDGFHVRVELCQRAPDRLGTTAALTLGIVVSIFKGMGNSRNCSYLKAVMFLEHGMKVVDRVL